MSPEEEEDFKMMLQKKRLKMKQDKKRRGSKIGKIKYKEKTQNIFYSEHMNEFRNTGNGTCNVPDSTNLQDPSDSNIPDDEGLNKNTLVAY